MTKIEKNSGIIKKSIQGKVVLTASAFEKAVRAYQSDVELEKIQRYFKPDNAATVEDKFLGIRMGQLFALAKEFVDMPISELEKLLESPYHEIRAGALSIMDKRARNKKTTAAQRKEMYELYLRRHDRINHWDLVDVSCIYVVGQYLFDKPRDILYQLAVSENMWERRTAIVATAYFLKHGDAKDTFHIAEILINDPEDLVQKAVGGWIRQAGVKHRQSLLQFLEKYAAQMPRVMLRYAIEHLDAAERKYYLGLKK